MYMCILYICAMTKACSKPCQTSNKECFAKIING